MTKKKVKNFKKSEKKRNENKKAILSNALSVGITASAIIVPFLTNSPEKGQIAGGILTGIEALTTALFPVIYDFYKNKTTTIEEKIYEDLKNELCSCMEDVMSFLTDDNKRKGKVRLESIDEETAKEVLGRLKDLNDNPTQDAVLNLSNKIEQMIGAETSQMMKSDFYFSLQLAIFRYPTLNALLNDAKLREDAARINKLECTMKPLISFVKNEFLGKIGKLANKDGMMGCLQKCFYVETRPTANVWRFLSKVQDEYNNEYANYNSDEDDFSQLFELPALLTSPEKMETDKCNIDLIDLYYKFIHADYMYFNALYSEAISEYEEIIKMLRNCFDSSSPINVDNRARMITYLRNSIAWSQHLNRDNDAAIATYKELFSAKDDITDIPFIWRFQRNFGVCLDNSKDYGAALEQFDAAMNLLPQQTSEYKIYVTYCTTLMKHWDIICGKSTRDWKKNVLTVMQSQNEFLCNRSIELIKAYLAIAEEKKSTFSDIRVQRVKLCTYEMLLSNAGVDSDMLRKLNHELLILDKREPNRPGTMFVKRDAYYAQYLCSDDNSIKLDCLNKAKTLNDLLLAMYKNNSEVLNFVPLFSELIDEETQ